jgi:multidrug efflux pump
MRIWLKPERMAAFNISPAQVRQALAANNFLAAVGQTKGALIQVNLTANTDLRSVEEFKRLVVRQQDGAIVRIEDIGDVVLGAEDYDAEVRFSGQTAVFMGIWPLPNANSLDVISRVHKEMDSISRTASRRHAGPGGLRCHQLHPQCHPRGDQDAESETLLIVV